jgi:hypothetical protein
MDLSPKNSPYTKKWELYTWLPGDKEMKQKEIISRIQAAQEKVTKDIQADHDRSGSKYACLAGEGFNGGYRAALNDVMLLITSGVAPSTNHWWEKE